MFHSYSIWRYKWSRLFQVSLIIFKLKICCKSRIWLRVLLFVFPTLAFIIPPTPSADGVIFIKEFLKYWKLWCWSLNPVSHCVRLAKVFYFLLGDITKHPYFPALLYSRSTVLYTCNTHVATARSVSDPPVPREAGPCWRACLHSNDNLFWTVAWPTTFVRHKFLDIKNFRYKFLDSNF